MNWNKAKNYLLLRSEWDAAPGEATSKVTAISDGSGSQVKSYIVFKTGDLDPIYGIIRVDKIYGSTTFQTTIDITVKCQHK